MVCEHVVSTVQRVRAGIPEALRVVKVIDARCFRGSASRLPAPKAWPPSFAAATSRGKGKLGLGPPFHARLTRERTAGPSAGREGLRLRRRAPGRELAAAPTPREIEASPLPSPTPTMVHLALFAFALAASSTVAYDYVVRPHPGSRIPLTPARRSASASTR